MASAKGAPSYKKPLRRLLPKETSGAVMHYVNEADIRSIIKKSNRRKNSKVEEIELFTCKTCKKEFKRRERLERHERIHSGELPFICASCGKGFRSKDSLSSHLAVHTDQKAFTCTQCSRSFKTSHELRKHQRLARIAISKNEPNDHCPVKCKLCSYQITSKRAGRLHMLTHKKKMRRPFVCSTCKESFSKLLQLGNHQRKMHEVKTEELYCHKCKKIFGDRPELEQHQQVQCLQPHVHQIHSYSKTPRRLYACYRCDKSFKKSSGLGRHLATHFEIDPYICNKCKLEFEDRLSYEHHQCLEESSVSTKPILVVKFLPQGMKQPALIQASETSLENETALHPAVQSPNGLTTDNQFQIQSSLCDLITEDQQQQLMETASETQNIPNFPDYVTPQTTTPIEEFNLQHPMHTQATGKKSVLFVKFLNKSGSQNEGALQIF